MKARRVLASVAALALMGTTAAYAEIDWASMDDATIESEIKNAQSELEKRHPSDDDGSKDPNKRTGKAVILDLDEIKVTATSFEVVDHWQYGTALQVNYLVENNGDKDFEAHLDRIAINDYEVDYVGYIEIGAGNKAKGDFVLKMSDAEVSSLNEIEKVTFTFHYYSEEDAKFITLKPKSVKLN